jgi:hypothetical protein
MSQLRRAISDLAEQFAASVLKALHGASLQDLVGLSGGGDAPRRGPGRPRKTETAAAAPSGATRLRRVKKGGRRSAKDLQGTIDAIVATLGKSKEGMRSEQIQKALGLTKKDVTRPLQLALSKKSIKKKGQKRATTYFAA